MKASSQRWVTRPDGPTRPPASPVEQLATSILKARGCLPLDELVEHVAEELYHEESRYSWPLDLGLLGSKLFVPSVAKEIETGNGSLWKIQEVEADPMPSNVGEHKNG